MGKFNKKTKGKHKKPDQLPFVSVCTPTFNRRPFIPYIIQAFLEQDYPQDKIEWVIIDDGKDKVEDLFKNVNNAKYFYYDEKMSLGKKRNLMHSKCSGDIIVYMDDDDYYPPCRISHAVEQLRKHPLALAAGSSELNVWFNDLNQMYRFGPYGPSHATAASFAIRKTLLKQTRYDETAEIAEEKQFLKDYTIPFVQLDPLKTILVVAHIHNSIDKHMFLSAEDTDIVRKSVKTPSAFIKNKDLLYFYTLRLHDELLKYDLGRPEHKPEIVKQVEKVKAKLGYTSPPENAETFITIQDQDGIQRNITREQVIVILNQQQQEIIRLNTLLANQSQMPPNCLPPPENNDPNTSHQDDILPDMTPTNIDTDTAIISSNNNPDDKVPLEQPTPINVDPAVDNPEQPTPINVDPAVDNLEQPTPINVDPAVDNLEQPTPLELHTPLEVDSVVQELTEGNREIDESENLHLEVEDKLVDNATRELNPRNVDEFEIL